VEWSGAGDVMSLSAPVCVWVGGGLWFIRGPHGDDSDSTRPFCFRALLGHQKGKLFLRTKMKNFVYCFFRHQTDNFSFELRTRDDFITFGSFIKLLVFLFLICGDFFLVPLQ
jgi:hypothetical protein